jgi:branched-chain amino acid transport system permease protein
LSLELVVLQVLNGLSFGSLLFLLASGFTLIYGLMRIVNLAHGAIYLVGGSVAVAMVSVTGSFVVALLAGVLVAALVGLISERFLLRRLRGQELREVLLTIGIALLIGDVTLVVFGGHPRSLEPPVPGSVALGPLFYPAYRLFIIGLALVIGLGLYLLQYRSRMGAIIRAGVDDREMAGAIGIDINRAFTALFVLGSALAGLAGVTAAGLLTMRPGADTDILLFALVVVIVGGLGSVGGAAVGSILIGLIDAFSKVWAPELSIFAVFAPMAIVLVLRPSGLLGRTA